MSRAPRTVRLPCHAKINLGLAVGARRDDGFHELVTLYQSVSLADELEVTAARGKGIRILCDDPTVPRDGTNLVARAYAALAESAGGLGGVAARLVKRIPAGGGLGGGSSDGAMALVAIDRLFGLHLGVDRLSALAAQLGSDVPYFLVGGLALGLGRGERVVPLEDLARRRHAVLVNPGQEVSTAEVYARRARARAAGPVAGRRGRLTAPDGASSIFRFLLERSQGEEDLSHLGNDLAAPARELVFGYDRMVTQLEGCGAELALLSGSGATVFALFGSRRQAQSAVGRLLARRVDVVTTVGRGEYSKRLQEGLGGRSTTGRAGHPQA